MNSLSFFKKSSKFTFDITGMVLRLLFLTTLCGFISFLFISFVLFVLAAWENWSQLLSTLAEMNQDEVRNLITQLFNGSIFIGFVIAHIALIMHRPSQIKNV